MTTGNNTNRVRFGPYEADLQTQELWKSGIRLKLGGQPFGILTLLLGRPGELVSREELRSSLWSSETFVDFNHGLNAAMNKLRDCLNDSAEDPKYIETLPRRGYRFIASVETTARAAVEPPPPLPPPAPAPQQSLSPPEMFPPIEAAARLGKSGRPDRRPSQLAAAPPPPALGNRSCGNAVGRCGAIGYRDWPVWNRREGRNGPEAANPWRQDRHPRLEGGRPGFPGHQRSRSESAAFASGRPILDPNRTVPRGVSLPLGH
jgi:DNA-binding winged helix-turn-helix (wHTH) protein